MPLIENPLPEIEARLYKGKVSNKQAHSYIDKCIDYLTSTEDETDKTLQRFLSLFDGLIPLLSPNDVYNPYYRSVVEMIRSNYQGYLEETERFYLAKSVKEPEWLDWFTADRFFVHFVATIPVQGDWDYDIERQIIQAHKKFSKKYFPNSAFDLYCKFWGSNGSYQYKIKLLRNVLNKDPGYALAWIKLGDLYYDQESWSNAVAAYQNGIQDKRTWTADVFFLIAWSDYKLKDFDSAIKYYQQCISLNPTYPYAQNNLGDCLNKVKRYEEAEPYFRFSMEHDEYIKDPCRNLFYTLEKLHKTDELWDLVNQYPEHFKTKYYMKRIEKFASEEVGFDELQSKLEKVTSNMYAGIINVSPERSGIQLYNHQKQAVQNLDKWKNKGTNGAGLLVLPTGGGKTLTATYWLMKSILDTGGKVLWIAHRHELLDQALRSFQRVCFQDLSIHKKEYQGDL